MAFATITLSHKLIAQSKKTALPDSTSIMIKKSVFGELDDIKAAFLLKEADEFEKKFDLKTALKHYFTLQNHYERTRNQKLQTHILLKIARLYENQKIPERAVDFYSRALLKIKTNQLTDFPKNDILVKIGEAQMELGKWSQAENSFFEVLNDENIKKESLYITVLSHLTELYRVQNLMDKLLNVSLEILEYQKQKGNQKLIALSSNNVGFAYKSGGDMEKARFYFNQALEAESSNSGPEYQNLLSIRINLASLFNYQKQYFQANSELQKALNLAQNKKDLNYQADILNFISLIKFNLQDYQNAFLICKKACGMAEKTGKKEILLRCYKTYSLVAEKMGDFEEALKFQKLQIQIQDSIYAQEKEQGQEKLFKRLQVERTEKELKLLLLDAEKSEFEYQKLALETQKKEQDFEIFKKEKALQEFSFKTKSLEDQKALQESQIKAQRLNQEKIMQELALKQFRISMINQAQEKTEKQNKISLLEKEKKLLEKTESLQKSELMSQRNKEKNLKIILSLIGIIFVSIVFGLIQIRKKNLILKKKQKEIENVNIDLEALNSLMVTKNQSITDSINYARGIQETFLPESHRWNSVFPHSFILNKPKDIVSGDFYFLTQVGKKWVLALADCTGHGVPGALMSIIGHNLLVSAVEINGIIEPEKILNQVNEGLIKTLKITEFNYADGIEMALCVFDFEEQSLTFASSRRPFYSLSKGELSEQKASRITLGKEKEYIPFETRRFLLKDLDFIYLLTDGYQDQMGGEGVEKKRFLSRRLKDLLVANYSKSPAEQLDILNRTMEKWMGEEPQLDDMLVIGIDVKALRKA